MTRWTYVLEMEGKPEDGWVVHRQILAMLKDMEGKAQAENLKVEVVHRSDGKAQGGGFLKRAIVGGGKGLWNWWNEPEDATS